MKVVLYHPVMLPPRNYGGVERVVLWLAKGLVKNGHEVSVVAKKGSILPKGVSLIAVDQSYSEPRDFFKILPQSVDVVHFMAPPSQNIQEQRKIPFVITIHGNGKENEIFHPNSIFISRNHAIRHGAQFFVYNGLDPDEYELVEKKSDQFLFFSKTSWKVKNLDGAIKLSQRANVKLQIAGGHRPFLKRALTYLNPNLTWIGPIDGSLKTLILGSSRALLFPVIWDEPFGLVVIEAMASGTPVLASKRGSLPELVTPQVGRILESDQQWIEALTQMNQNQLHFSPSECRKHVIENFHYQVMAKNYEKLYHKVITDGYLHPFSPQSSKEPLND